MCGELTPIPVGNDVVETVFLLADGHFLAWSKFGLSIAVRIVGIIVRLHIQ